MGNNSDNKYSASSQYLGYTYQSRFALYYLLGLSEDTSLFIEKEDDVVFINEHKLSLGSMKHKRDGDVLTNLSNDFWKSVNVWLYAYEKNGRISSSLLFILFTTSSVASSSFLNNFLIPDTNTNDLSILSAIESALSETISKIVLPIKEKYNQLKPAEKKDFLSRIRIADKTPRIENLRSKVIDKYFRAIKREVRDDVYDHFIGWWEEQVLGILTKTRKTPISCGEAFDKISSIGSEYDYDNLPINFSTRELSNEEYRASEQMQFVKQLKEIDVPTNTVTKAITDYYRAYEQRSLWARKQLWIDGEILAYENKLVDEWERVKDAFTRGLKNDVSEKELKDIGFKIFQWAEFEANTLRIREKVTENYVRRGHFHLLANEKPLPRVYWHPFFLKRLESIFKGMENGTME